MGFRNGREDGNLRQNPVALVITGSRQSAAPWFPAIGGSASKCSKWQLRKNGTHLERRVQGSGSCKESVTAPSGVEDTLHGLRGRFYLPLSFYPLGNRFAPSKPDTISKASPTCNLAKAHSQIQALRRDCHASCAQMLLASMLTSTSRSPG